MYLIVLLHFQEHPRPGKYKPVLGRSRISSRQKMPQTDISVRRSQYKARDQTKDAMRGSQAIASLGPMREVLITAANRTSVKNEVAKCPKGQNELCWTWLPNLLKSDQDTAALILIAPLGVGRSSKMKTEHKSKQGLETEYACNITSLHLLAIRSALGMTEPSPKVRPNRKAPTEAAR